MVRHIFQQYIALLLMLAAFQAAGQQPGAGPFDSPRQARPFHYFNGDVRVERLVALDEVLVRSASAQALRLEAGPGASVRSVGRDAGRVAVRFETPAAGLADLNARAARLRAPGRSVRAVAFAPGASDRGDAHLEVISDRLSVKFRASGDLERVLREYDLEVDRRIGQAHVLRVKGEGLMAAVEAANAIYASGIAEFATPLIEKQQQPRLIPNDSLFGDQWHLNNTAQVTGAVAGHDANVIETWDTYTGDGINIAVADTGVEVSHPDLAANARTDIDWDINDNDEDPSPHFGSHGTSVAGIAAAVGNNNAGVSGAAFDAGIVGLRLIEDPTTDLGEATAMAHQIDPESAEDRVHINNNSWGPFDDGQRLETFGPLTETALIDGVTIGRGGRGVVYVWAGGNGRESGDNVNYDGYASSRYTIAVGASGADGAVSYYSEPGASMLVNAPSSYTFAGTTTTTTGSAYTSSFGGTSSAAPLAAGAIALMLEANPQLGWRDVQHILVDTAYQNSPGSGGWIANGSGRLFNQDYGFGRINTGAAVTRSLGWVNLDPASSIDSGVQAVNTAIPDGNTAGITNNITLSSVPEGFFVEHVEVVLNTSHPRGGDLRVELSSPAGTESVLATPHSDRTTNYSNWKFTSVAHWGEDPGGTWSLNVSDPVALQPGSFIDWRLVVHGFTISTDLVGFDAGHTGYVNGHPNWPFSDFEDAYAAVDAGGTVYVQSDFVFSEPATLSKPVTIRTSKAPVRLSVD